MFASLKSVFFTGLFACLFFSVTAQERQMPKGRTIDESRFGVSDAALIDMLMPSVPGVSAAPGVNLSEQSVKPYLMPVRRISSSGSELSYVLAGWLEYYVNLDKNYKVNLSPDYIALNLQSMQQQRSLPNAFRFLAEYGTVSAAIMSFGSTSIPNAVFATPKFRINNYLHIFREETRERQRIFEVRKALMRGNPVMVEVLADNSLKEARGVSSWQSKGRMDAPYYLLIIGFDEEREAFEVTSPWGSEWGRAGYLWISYDDMSKQARNGFVLVPEM